MKKVLSFVLSVLMLISTIPLYSITSFADPIERYNYENFIYSILSDDTISIDDYTGLDNSNMVIPSTIAGRSVTSIGNYAFSDFNRLTSITIPNSVINIGRGVFGGCICLTSITIPDSVASIGESAFTGCTSLINITVDADNQYYSNDDYGVMFDKDKTTLLYYPEGNTRDSYIIPDSVTHINAHAFYNCDSLSNIIIGNNTTNIGDWAFDDCDSLTSVTIGNSVTSIGEQAFRGCESLSNIIIGDSVTNIGYSAFSDCTGLTSITIPDSVTNIGDTAFSDCTGLTSITIPDSVTNIGNHALAGCTGLTSITIPDSVTNIGNHAFARCTGLTSITIPDSVTSIGDCVFSDCHNLISINVDTNNKCFSSDDCGVLFNKDKTELIRYPANNACMNYTIPDSVINISECAFYNCLNLISITIPNSVINAGFNVFSGCKSLVSINVDSDNKYYSNDDYGVLFNKDKTILMQYPIGNTRESYIIPDSVINIDYHSFEFSTYLKNVIVGNSVTNISNYAFWKCCSLKSIIIPDNVISIGSFVFQDCSEMENVILGNGITSIEYSSFSNCTSLTSVKIGNSVNSIDDYAFNNCKSLKSITLPDSVTSIGVDVFYNCISLTDINVENNNEYYSNDDCGVLFNKDKTMLIQYPIGSTRENYIIPDGVAIIGDGAFVNCYNLISVTIPCSVTRIKGSSYFDNVFSGCTNLTDIKVDSNNEYFSSDSYGVLFNKDKTTLIQYPIGNTRENYIIPDSVTYINYHSFKFSTYIKSITLGKSVRYIDAWAFYYCDNLESVIIGNNVEGIGFNAFFGCTSLKSISITNKVTVIEDNAFRNCSNLTDVVIGNKVKDIEDTSFQDCRSLKNIRIPDSVEHIGIGTFYNCDSLTDVYYTGSEEQWNEISIGKYNEVLTDVTIHFNHICDFSTLSHYEDSHPHYAVYECKCGLTQVTAETATLDSCEICNPTHYHTEIIVRIDPTCTVNGMEYTMCDVCGETLGETTIIPASHNPIQVRIDPTCTEDGKEYTVCDTCGETISEITILEATGHSWGEWIITVEAQDYADGEQKRECAACGEVETEVIPMLRETIKDDKSGAELDYGKDAYEGEVELSIEEIFDGSSFQIVGTINGAAQTRVFDIKTLKDGVEVQPNSKVIVRIPLPDGFNPERTFVKHINSVTNEVEDMNARYEDGYLVFETTHFSHYAIVEIGEEEKCTISINTPSRTTIRCKDGIILHANVTGTLPEGAKVVWSTNNNYFKTKNVNADSFQIISNNNGYTTVTVSIVDADGDVIATDSVEMYSKAGFGDKIGGFFRSLFGATRIYEN